MKKQERNVGVLVMVPLRLFVIPLKEVLSFKQVSLILSGNDLSLNLIT